MENIIAPPHDRIKLLPLETVMGLESCEFCKYWVGGPINPDLSQPRMGLCRRFPPFMVLAIQAMEAPGVRGRVSQPQMAQIPAPLKPATAAEDYCGEFTSKNAQR